METALDTPRRSARNVSARGDLFDALLRWAHRVLNPPMRAPARAKMGERRRIRDRVPL
jgi:hypothetical protein